MLNVLNALKNVASRITSERIKCPCGYVAKSEAQALQHLNVHPTKIGSIDIATGLVSW